MENEFTEKDMLMMRRALELAEHGRGNVSPNPMVGAVIVGPDGRVIGEGWHRRFGEGHAEVNAVASVSEKDLPLLEQSTMYVTLEPCSHYGKTPPCARMIVEKRIPRVVVATVDPNEKVAGRGIAILEEAGVEVTVGVCGQESRELNRKFMTAHTLGRPFITLKWAQSADGFMDHDRSGDEGACRFSNAQTTLSTMHLRADNDAVLTTAATVNADNSRLTVRDWDGRQPRRVVLDRHGILRSDASMLTDGAGEVIVIREDLSPEELMHRLRMEYGITSVLVEAGPRFLETLISAGLWDEARIETAPIMLGDRGRHPAPVIANRGILMERYEVDGNNMEWWRRRN